jgi:hypothetical protein
VDIKGPSWQLILPEVFKMQVLKSLCILLTLCFQVISGQDCPEGFEISQVDGNCYSYNTSALSWDQARTSCQECGGFLFEPRTDGDMKILSTLLSSRKRPFKGNGGIEEESIWLGASFLDGKNLVFDSNLDATAEIDFEAISDHGDKKDSALVKTRSGFGTSLKKLKKPYFCAYKPFWPCWNCPWYKSQCCCENNVTPYCLQFNTLYLEESLPMTMSLTNCQLSCQRSTACKVLLNQSSRIHKGVLDFTIVHKVY